MRNWQFCLALFGFFAFVIWQTPSAMAADNNWSQILSYGDSGDAVARLQEDLRQLGYFTYPTDTGYFGDVTKAAVEGFQRDYHLTVNGEVGKTTGPKIDQELAILNAHTKKSSSSDKTSQLINYAKKFIGTPYAWGGTDPSGFDCSGFVSYVFKQVNVDLPHSAADDYNLGTAVSSLKTGDLVFFTTYGAGATHVGIYVGDNNFISASDNGVEIDTLSSGYWANCYLGAKRINF